MLSNARALPDALLLHEVAGTASAYPSTLHSYAMLLCTEHHGCNFFLFHEGCCVLDLDLLLSRVPMCGESVLLPCVTCDIRGLPQLKQVSAWHEVVTL